MAKKEHLVLMGARIRSELNDLKRTPEAAAVDLDFDPKKLNEIINGNSNLDETYSLISKMGRVYPIDVSDLYSPEDDCTNGIRIMRKEESDSSSRIFDRKDRNGADTPYYDYRDTAMSKLSPFKPEWIKELRVVDNSDPENPDVAYNHGHLLHQTTFFIGPVNFYWEVNGKKYSAEMNTGDSNYITPFNPHSFTSRNKDEDALIIAVTFGGDVRRAQKELYSLGSRIERSILDYKNHDKAIIELIEHHMKNEKISFSNLEELLRSKGNLDGSITKSFDGKHTITDDELGVIAEALNLEKGDLFIPRYKYGEEVIVKHKNESGGYLYPDRDNPIYRIHPLARSSKMPLMKGFDMDILGKNVRMDHAFESLLHSYFYNYGEKEIFLSWEFGDNRHNEVLYPGDSMYMQPLIKHAFSNPYGKPDPRLLGIGVSGAVNFTVQKELSYLPDIRRVSRETKQWF